MSNTDRMWNLSLSNFPHKKILVADLLRILPNYASVFYEEPGEDPKYAGLVSHLVNTGGGICWDHSGYEVIEISEMSEDNTITIRIKEFEEKKL